MLLYNSATHNKEEFIHPRRPARWRCIPAALQSTTSPTSATCAAISWRTCWRSSCATTGYDVNRVMNITDVGHLGLRRRHRRGQDAQGRQAGAQDRDGDRPVLHRCLLLPTAQKLNIKTSRRGPARHRLHRRVYQDHLRAAGKGLCLSAPAATCTLTPPSWSATTSSTTTTRRTWQSACARAWKRTPTSATRTDFVLWFTKSKFEDQALKWDSPWGVGYPGLAHRVLRHLPEV